MSEQTLGSDVLFSCSTVPRSPTTRGVPLRRPSYKLGIKLHGGANTRAADALPFDAALDSDLSSLERKFILKKEQLLALNSFITKKDVFALLPTGFDWL